MAIIFNSLFMAIVFTAFHKTRKLINNDFLANVSLIVYWISFEYFHHNWDLSWSWLTLGNCFAFNTQIVQWYEYTGVFGGSLWVLLINIFLFDFIKNIKFKIFNYSKLFIILSLIFLPIILSLFRYYSYIENGNKVKVEIVQPNIDPYNEKFNSLSSDEQVNKMLNLANRYIIDKPDYVVGPETALPDGYWENNLLQYSDILKVKNFIFEHPKTKFVLGMSSYKMYVPNEEITPTARLMNNSSAYYDAFNTAMQIDTSKVIQLYHKSKLVPGVELMPFPAVFKYLDKFAINMGGTSGSLGMQKERSVFVSKNDTIKIAPIICYESVYGGYVTEYVRNGAHLLFIITNDGWWGNTEGYRQHLNYARLRAIENRRSIARSANTGISCFINQKGDIIKSTSWWKPEVIIDSIMANNEITFYAQFGDYIGKIAIYITVILLLYLAGFKYLMKIFH
jgi:apolipoprotein N-acyltransferase